MLETLLYQRVNVANDFVSAGIIATILITMSFGSNLLFTNCNRQNVVSEITNMILLTDQTQTLLPFF